MADLGQELASGLAAFHAARQRKRQAAQGDLQTLLVQAKIAEALRRTAASSAPTAAGFVRDPVSGRMLRDPGFFNPELERSKALANVSGQLAALDAFNQGQPTSSMVSSLAAEPKTLGQPRRKLIVTGLSGNKLNIGFDPAALAAEKTKQIELVKAAVAKQKFRTAVEPVIALESRIPRVAGGNEMFGLPIERLGQGLKNFAAGVLQKGPIGENISAYQDAVKQITPLMARAAGDTANIAIQERKMSQAIFPTVFDSAGTAELKRKFLSDFSHAINDKNKTSVKQLLDRQGIPYFDFATNQWVNISPGETPPALGGVSRDPSTARDLSTMSDADLQRIGGRS